MNSTSVKALRQGRLVSSKKTKPQIPKKNGLKTSHSVFDQGKELQMKKGDTLIQSVVGKTTNPQFAATSGELADTLDASDERDTTTNPQFAATVLLSLLFFPSTTRYLIHFEPKTFSI
eukprot:g3766.t1